MGMENNLPKGWANAKLKDLCDMVYGKGLLTKFLTEEGYPVYGANGIIGKYSKYIYKEPQVIISCRGAASGVIHKTIPYSFVTSNSIVLQLNSKAIDLDYFQKSIMSVDRSKIVTGSAQPQITIENLNDLEFPIAPLSEQHRIVAKLDAVMQKVESNKQRLDKIPKLLKRFRQSVLAAAVSGKLTEDWRKKKEYVLETDLPLNWKLEKIDKLVNSTKTDLRTGPFGTALKKNEHQPTGIPVWGIESIGENGSFTGYNKIFVTKEKAKELKSFEVKGGNIIISRSGTVGEICILPDDVQYGLISTNLMKIVLNNDIILSKYFCWLFDGSQIVIDKLRELCTGSTRLFLTQTILKQIDYPLPPRVEQIEIIRRVEHLFVFADKIEARYTKAKTMLDRLPQSILAKAFRGELVAQDPNDEPASVLLERIKAEKEKLAVEKKGKKTNKK